MEEQLIDTLRDCLDVLDNYSDVVDGADGFPRPNRAMAMITAIERVLAMVEKG